jgi:hypothetical protein
MPMLYQPTYRKLPAGLRPVRSERLLNEWPIPGGGVFLGLYRTEHGYLLRFPGLAEYEVSEDAARVDCYPTADLAEAAAEHLYLNQVLPLVLGKRGNFVFHASAVEVHGVAVAFAAASGRGKSTLAASFAVNRQRFLTDDSLVLEEDGDDYLVLPSHPSIRLWRDSEQALLPSGAEQAPALPFTPKSRFLAGDAIPYRDSAIPLGRICFLGEGSAGEIRLESLTPANAFLELVRHSFLLELEEPTLLASHFDRITRLARHPIFFRLDFPRRYEVLPRVRETLIDALSRPIGAHPPAPLAHPIADPLGGGQ